MYVLRLCLKCKSCLWTEIGQWSNLSPLIKLPKIVKCVIIYVYVYMVYPCNFIVIYIHKEYCLELGYKYYKAQWWEMCELFGINEQQFYISDDNISRVWTWNCFSRTGNGFLLIHPYFISLSVSLKDTSVVASGMEQNPWPAQG